VAEDESDGEIGHFFEIYKDPEPGKETSVRGFEGRKAALGEIQASRERFGANRPANHVEVQP
jgi:inorganic pyrophosphatase